MRIEKVHMINTKDKTSKTGSAEEIKQFTRKNLAKI
jgi:hypothetical protein